MKMLLWMHGASDEPVVHKYAKKAVTLPGVPRPGERVSVGSLVVTALAVVWAEVPEVEVVGGPACDHARLKQDGWEIDYSHSS